MPANHASTWPAACHELEQNAPAGSEWPQHSKLVLDKVAELLGGRWLVVQSGNFSAEQPRADQPARALVHVVMCYTNEQGGHLDSPVQGAPQQDGAEPLHAGSTSSTQQGVAKPAGKDSKVPPVIQPLKQPTKVAQLPPGSTPMYYLVAYQLDDNHWPTGERPPARAPTPYSTNDRAPCAITPAQKHKGPKARGTCCAPAVKRGPPELQLSQAPCMQLCRVFAY